MSILRKLRTQAFSKARKEVFRACTSAQERLDLSATFFERGAWLQHDAEKALERGEPTVGRLSALSVCMMINAVMSLSVKDPHHLPNSVGGLCRSCWTPVPWTEEEIHLLELHDQRGHEPPAGTAVDHAALRECWRLTCAGFAWATMCFYEAMLSYPE